MLAKPSKLAGDCRVTKIIAGGRAARRGTKAGETASAKRTQGTAQAAGSLAGSPRLIQLRKSLDVEADLLTLQGRQHRSSAPWQARRGSTGVA
jgi:hypothetical protein